MSEVRRVAQQGEAILSLQAAAIEEEEFSSHWLTALIQSMHATMDAKAGVGIAAPQIYVSKRVIIVASRPNIRYPDAPDMPALVMINPEILSSSAQVELGEEGCLSVAEQRGIIARAAHIIVRFQRLDGTSHEQAFSGFPARIVQHEIDHLNGVLFVDYLSA
jgi:peptide deformylase